MYKNSQQKKQYRSLFLLIFFIIVILISCQHDETDLKVISSIKPIERLTLKNAPEALNLFNYVKNLKTDQKSTDSLNLPEDVLKTINSNGKTSYSYKVDLQNGLAFFRNLLITKTIKGWVGYYLDYYPDYLWIFMNDSIPRMKYFTGKIKKYDLYNNLIYITYFQNGKMYKYSLKESKSQDYCIHVTDYYFWIDGIGQVPNCDTYVSSSTGINYPNCDVMVQGYEIPCNTDGGGTSTWPDGSTDAGTQIPGTGTTTGGSTGGGTSGTTQGVNNPVIPIVDPSDLLTKPRIACIYQKLVQTNIMGKYVREFDGEFSLLNLRYQYSTSLPSNQPGKCSLPDRNHWISISLNDQLADIRPVLNIAVTLIHETIHAEMMRLMYEEPNCVPESFPELFNYYVEHKSGQDTPEHQLMANKYVAIMVSALKEFDNSQHSDQLYEDLAWNGLQGTVAFQNKSYTERTRIINSIINFTSNGSMTCTSAPLVID